MKTNTLTPAGIKSIAGAMTTEMEILSSVAKHFGDQADLSDRDRLFDVVREILSSFRVLLAIDNTETIARDALRPLFLDIPVQSKILLTSRIGIGEFETRYPLEPMTPRDAIDLIRRISKLLNVEGLVSKPNNEVESLCKSLFNNPLAIRWFVQSYSEGKSISSLIDRRRDLSEVLKFCFENLYEVLTQRRREYLRILVSLGKPLSEVQLALLSGVNDVESVRSDLRYLFGSNLLRRSRDTWDHAESLLWAPSEFAKEFILSNDKPLSVDQKRYQSKFRELVQARDIARDFASANRFLVRTIEVKSTDESTVVILLQKALQLSYDRNHSAAIDVIKEACRLLPEFYEVWRISAQVKARAGDLLGAGSDFEKAVELADGQSEPLLLHYAQFLISQDQIQEASLLLERIASSEKSSTQLKATFAWVEVRLGHLNEAIKIYENEYENIKNLGGNEKRQFLTQFANALRRNVENSRKRHRLDNAKTYGFRSLEVILDACKEKLLDNGIKAIGAKCINEMLITLSSTRSISDWEHVQHICLELSQYFKILGNETMGLNLVTQRFPEITSVDSFRKLFIPEKNIDYRNDGVINGNIIFIDKNKGFATIRAVDGIEYFLHVSEIQSDIMWEKLNVGTEVEFSAGEIQSGRKLTRAIMVYIVHG